MNQVGKVLCWPRKKYRKIQRSVRNLPPRKKWELVLKTCDFLMRMIGIHIFSDCKISWWTPIPGLFCAQLAFLSVYTAWYYWDENKITSIQPQILTGFAIPNLVLYSHAVSANRYQYQRLLTFSSIYLNRKPCTDYERKVDEHAGNLIIRSIITAVLMVISFTFIIIGTIHAYVVHGEHATPTGVILPFFDPGSTRGYAINIFLQAIISAVGLIALVGIEGGSCIINNTYTAMADLVCFNMRKFSDGLCQGTFSYQNKTELRNIFVQLQDLEIYLNQTIHIYYWKFFLQPILTTGCVALGILAQLTNGFPTGYGTALCLYLQLFILCNMGNGVKNACEQIKSELYRIKWYMMPPKYQRQVAAALHRWQKGCVITIGPFEELNYVTATQLTKKIYSTLMVFMSFV